MIGDKRLEMPKTVGEAAQIYQYFGLNYTSAGQVVEMFFPNARRLVELNNEVYDKLHCKKCHRSTARELCPDCKEMDDARHMGML